MIAPMSAHIENSATARPLRLPAASPTAAAGAVPRNAEATPYALSTAISSQTFGTNGTSRIETPAIAPPAIMAGRRPTVSVNFPAGPTATVWATDAQAKAIPVQAGGRRAPRPPVPGSATYARRTPSSPAPGS